MNKDQLKKQSKFLSLVLRHRPEVIDLSLDKNGWANVNELIDKVNASGKTLDLTTLKKIVEENDKKRFAFSEDETKIRASQGHSLAIALNLSKQQPPVLLYHGTAERNIDSIKQSGLDKRNRQHVHLSQSRETALAVGARYGRPVLLKIAAQEMEAAGFDFFCSDNGVWLTDRVPKEFIAFDA